MGDPGAMTAVLIFSSLLVLPFGGGMVVLYLQKGVGQDIG
jgi:hypothetical protein